MNVTERHIESKKRIGTLRGQAVIEVKTTGGLYMVVCNKSGGIETLGTGPHRAVARFIAQKREPTLVVTELSKSDYLDEAAIRSVLAKYEQITDQLRELEKALEE